MRTTYSIRILQSRKGGQRACSRRRSQSCRNPRGRSHRGSDRVLRQACLTQDRQSTLVDRVRAGWNRYERSCRTPSIVGVPWRRASDVRGSQPLKGTTSSSASTADPHSPMPCELHRRHLPASPMRFFGFDSFQGLPPLTGVDKTTEFSEGQFACALGDVRAKLDGKVDWSRVHLVEGWFEDSLTQELKDRLRPAPVAVTLIDCDLYGSTLSVLAFLEDLLQEGSMLLFDDWDCFGRQDHMGERRAFREFLEARPWFTPRSGYGSVDAGRHSSCTLGLRGSVTGRACWSPAQPGSSPRQEAPQSRFEVYCSQSSRARRSLADRAPKHLVRAHIPQLRSLTTR